MRKMFSCRKTAGKEIKKLCWLQKINPFFNLGEDKTFAEQTETNLPSYRPNVLSTSNKLDCHVRPADGGNGARNDVKTLEPQYLSALVPSKRAAFTKPSRGTSDSERRTIINGNRAFRFDCERCRLTRGAAFTLAEVLITLGIIGVVAALTMPTLIEKHQKKVTATRLKAFYSTMAQAFQNAKSDYGDFNNWESSTFYDLDQPDVKRGDLQLQWLEKYLLPYIKYTKAYHTGRHAVVALPNGSGFSTYNRLYFYCVKFSDCKKEPEIFDDSHSRFIFQLEKDVGFEPYDFRWNGTREELFERNSAHHACERNYSGMCAKLIQLDGWEIKDDYPW